MDSRIAQLLTECGGDVKALNKLIKQAAKVEAVKNKTPKAPKADPFVDVKEKLLTIAKEYPKISLKRFKAEAMAAWNEMREEFQPKALNPYQQFLKDTLPQVKIDMPDVPHQERVKKIAEMWNAKKGTDGETKGEGAAVSASESDVETKEAVQDFVHDFVSNVFTNVVDSIQAEEAAKAETKSTTSKDSKKRKPVQSPAEATPSKRVTRRTKAA